MGHKVKQSLMSSRIDFFYYAFRNILFISLPLAIIAAIVLTTPHSSTTVSALDTSNLEHLTLSIPVSCTMNITGSDTHFASVVSGTYTPNIGTTTMKTLCNDPNGYVIYAIGASGDNSDPDNAIEGHTDLISSLGSNYNIHTGVYDSSNPTASSWSMKVTAVNGTYKPTLGDYYASGNYVSVPNNWQKVAYWESGIINSTVGSSIQTTYDVYTDGAQPAGTYKGMVKYVLLHPSSLIQPTTLEGAFDSTIGKDHKVDVGGSKYYKMQDMTHEICSTATILGEASQMKLVDIRDNSLYYVTKLLDGNCWMTENLSLNLDSNVALTSDTTDLNNIYNTTTTEYGEYDAGYSKAGDTISWTPNTSTVNTTAQWNNNNNAPRSLDSGGGYTDASIGDHGLTGNYYNWSAAIASNNSAPLSADNIAGENRDATNSICPKGWRLPRIRNYVSYDVGENDFANLNFYYNGGKTNTSAGLMAAPVYFVLSGSTSGGFSGRGHYRSSTPRSPTGSYNLNMLGGSVNPSGWDFNGGESRYIGFSVRCIAR